MVDGLVSVHVLEMLFLNEACFRIRLLLMSGETISKNDIMAAQPEVFTAVYIYKIVLILSVKFLSFCLRLHPQEEEASY